MPASRLLLRHQHALPAGQRHGWMAVAGRAGAAPLGTTLEGARRPAGCDSELTRVPTSRSASRGCRASSRERMVPAERQRLCLAAEGVPVAAKQPRIPSKAASDADLLPSCGRHRRQRGRRGSSTPSCRATGLIFAVLQIVVFYCGCCGFEFVDGVNLSDIAEYTWTVTDLAAEPRSQPGGASLEASAKLEGPRAWCIS